MPFLPERKLICQKDFIDKFHTIVKVADKYDYESNFRYKCEDQLDTYKYVFNNVDDWIGPLNYLRNFMFCRVKKNAALR